MRDPDTFSMFNNFFSNFDYNSDFFALVYIQRKVNVVFPLPGRKSTPFALFPRDRIVAGTNRKRRYMYESSTKNVKKHYQ